MRIQNKKSPFKFPFKSNPLIRAHVSVLRAVTQLLIILVCSV